MVRLLFWIGSTVAAGYLFDQAGDAAEQAGTAAEKSAKLAKWVVIGGGLYVGYEVLRAGKVIR